MFFRRQGVAAPNTHFVRQRMPFRFTIHKTREVDAGGWGYFAQYSEAEITKELHTYLVLNGYYRDFDSSLIEVYTKSDDWIAHAKLADSWLFKNLQDIMHVTNV